MSYSIAACEDIPGTQHKPIGILKSVSLALLLCLLLAAGSSAFSQQENEHKIVVLFHNADFTVFKREFSDGMRNYLDEAQTDFPYLRVTYEFLGLNRPSAAARTGVVVDLLKSDQRDDPASVVISTLSPAARFLLEFGDEIYPGTPKVYTAPGPEIVANLTAATPPNVKIIPTNSAKNIENTLNLISRLLPETEHIYVHSGVAEIDLEFLEHAKRAVDRIMPTTDVTYLSGLPVNELSSALMNLPEDSAIMMLSHGLDRNRVSLRSIEVLRGINDTANAPIFSFVDHLFSEGIVGGSTNSNLQIGRITAEVALSALSGADTGNVSTRAASYRFDQRQLRRWGIDEDLLPPGSILENQQPSFLDLYGQQLLILFLVLAVSLFIMVFFKRQAVNLGIQKTLFESVINSIPDAILISDLNANLVNSNKAAEEMFGVSQDRLLGSNTGKMIDYAVIEDQQGRSGVLESSIQPQVIEYRKVNGGTFFGETIATEFTSTNGEVLGYFALVRDISKRLSLEEEQRQGQKMEALGNLVGGISHDFNNVLGVISGYAELSLINNESEALEENQNQILSAIERAKSLISQIMTFSRDTNISQKPIDLPILLDETMDLIKASIPSDIELTVEKGEAVPTIMGSAIQLQQILINLTANSYQAMKTSGGSITISMERKDVSTEMNLSHGVLSPGHYAVLSVVDSGPGMSKEIAARIFEPFFTTKAQGEGSGMGMTIVYNLAKIHGATLDLQTAQGKGTRITLYFEEAADSNPVLEADNMSELIRGKGERILLVDDEEHLLDATQRLLSSLDYQVTAFSDPTEALAAFQGAADEFDLLVSDQSMPKITGIQLLRKMRSLNPQFPAIICTGYRELLNQQDTVHLDLHGIVDKPYTLGQISRAVAEALAS